MNNTEKTTVDLVVPTIFPDLNAKEGMESGYARSTLNISRLKFSHLKKMQTLTEEEQMVYALSSLAGLSESDLDELDAVDSANIMMVIYGYMESFFKLANKMTHPPAAGS